MPLAASQTTSMSAVSPSADHWKLRSRTLALGQLPLLMGIVNVTPDSFSDGGRFFDAEAAVEHGLRLAAEGADLLDVGGESTRPGSMPVDAEEEFRRLMPVVEQLCKRTHLPVSIDTSKASVARRAVEAGAEIINDVTAFAGDPAMIPLAAETGCGVCAMHCRGTPRTMQDDPDYADVVAEVLKYLCSRRDALLAAGIQQDRIALDPGIGFGKTTEHNLQLLANAQQFHQLGCPILIGHSRKRFLSAFPKPLAASQTPAPRASPPESVAKNATADRIVGTVAVALALARQKVQILRVHDVAAVREALWLFESTGGLS
jgi:dihydropteroate synthase